MMKLITRFLMLSTNLIAKFLAPSTDLAPSEVLVDESLTRYGYSSNRATAATEIEPGGEGQVLYEGVYWTVQYLKGDKKISLGQMVHVRSRVFTTKLVISEINA